MKCTKRKRMHILVISGMVCLSLPVIINIVLSLNLIPSKYTNSGDWLGFWGSFLGSIIGGISTLGG